MNLSSFRLWAVGGGHILPGPARGRPAQLLRPITRRAAGIANDCPCRDAGPWHAHRSDVSILGHAIDQQSRPGRVRVRSGRECVAAKQFGHLVHRWRRKQWAGGSLPHEAVFPPPHAQGRNQVGTGGRATWGGIRYMESFRN